MRGQKRWPSTKRSVTATPERSLRAPNSVASISCITRESRSLTSISTTVSADPIRTAAHPGHVVAARQSRGGRDAGDVRGGGQDDLVSHRHVRRPRRTNHRPRLQSQNHAGQWRMNDITVRDLESLPPTLDLVTAAKILGIGRTKAYDLAKRGQFPVHTIRVGEQ